MISKRCQSNVFINFGLHPIDNGLMVFLCEEQISIYLYSNSQHKNYVNITNFTSNNARDCLYHNKKH